MAETTMPVATRATGGVRPVDEACASDEDRVMKSHARVRMTLGTTRARGLTRRGRAAALAIEVLALLAMTHSAFAECMGAPRTLPCDYGGCTFS